MELFLRQEKNNNFFDFFSLIFKKNEGFFNLPQNVFHRIPRRILCNLEVKIVKIQAAELILRGGQHNRNPIICIHTGFEIEHI